MKRITALFLVIFLLFQTSVTVLASEPPGDLKAESAILIEQKSGKVLFEKDGHKKLFPASTTKIITTLLALEHLDLDEVVTVGDEIYFNPLDGSSAGLTVGERITVKDLLWALMLPSGNDAAYTVAVHVARKVSGNPQMGKNEAVTYFVDMMNKKAKELGAVNTNCVTPCGYHHEEHYTTAYDLALISREAMKHDVFREIVSTYDYDESQVPVPQKRVRSLWLNVNALINRRSKYFYPYATGIKTGHTTPAGYCLVASASKDGLDLIAVVLKESKEEDRWNDTVALFEYGFDNFDWYLLGEEGKTAGNIAVNKGISGRRVEIEAGFSSDLSSVLSKDEAEKIEKTIIWDEKLKNPKKADELMAPIQKGQKLGKMVFSSNGSVIGEVELVAMESVEKDNFTGVFILVGRHLAKHYIAYAMFILVVSVAAALVLRRRRVRQM